MEAPLRSRHFFTIDVEDHFHSEESDPSKWSRHSSRIEGSTRTVLDLCAEASVRGTFFVLGWVARRHPGLVRAIAAAGHEVASHGMNHQFVYRQGPDEFREDVHASRVLLEELTGQPVRGYRAPYFSIVERTPWAHAILAETGYSYSSSVFPGANPRYGIPGHPQGPRAILTPSGAEVWEVPVTTFFSRIGWGGVYFRSLPQWWFDSRVRLLELEGRSAVFYFHPWELDPGNPPARGSLGLRLRHQFGVRGAAARLRRLITTFRFEPVRSLWE